jgi:hypothetical protein
MRIKAKETAASLERQGVTEVYLPGDDEMTDIMRLTCLENGITVRVSPGGVTVWASGTGFSALYPHGTTEPDGERE